MKNRKGFTLIEILAVIIIIGIIAIIAIPSISKYLNSSKDTVYTSYEKSMVDAAKNKIVECLTENINCELPEKEEELKIYLDTLIEDGYLDNMKDPETKQFCEAANSYIKIKGDNVGEYKYKACLYCGDYFTDDIDCSEVNNTGTGERDPENPTCGTITGDSTRWSNQNRTVSVGCSDVTTGCVQSVFSKTFTRTTKVGKVIIRDKSGNTEDCEVNVYVDKTSPSCKIEMIPDESGEYIEETGWYSLKATAALQDMKDGTDESGLLTYGMGTSLNNREYNQKTKLEVGKGITTVIGYTKDKAGNEGTCGKEVRVGTEIPKFNLFYGYPIFPNNDSNILLDGMSISGSNFSTSNTTPKITVTNTTKYKDVEKVIITLNSEIRNQTTATLKAGSVTKIALMQPGSTKIEFLVPKGTYDSYQIQLGTLSGVTYNVKKIELLTKDGSAWTRQDITMYVEPIDEGMQTTAVSYDNGSTWVTTFSKTYTAKTTNTVLTKNGIGMISRPTEFTTRIDKVMPTSILTAKRKSNGAVVLSSVYTNEGLNFTFNQQTVGNSGAHIYYCKDTNNTCTPNIEVTSGATITTYNNITTDYYIRYRIVSNADSIGDIEVYIAKFDLTPPSCTNGGDSTSWTSGNRTITWGCSDAHSTCDPSYSGGSKTFNTSTKTATIDQYIIKDKAGNSTTCPARTANVYVDKDNPTCSWSGESTSWTSSNRSITATCADTGSGCTSGTASKTWTYSSGTTKTASLSYTITDGVGHSVSCSKTVNVYVDKDNPTCSWSGESTNWTSGNRTITATCADTGSGCTSGTASKSWSYTSGTTKTASLSYTITDGVGHSVSCSKTANVYVDKDNPTCSWSGEGSSWTSGNRTITATCADSGSGCTSGTASKSWTYSSGTTSTAYLSYTITDGVGHSVTCGKTAGVYVDKDNATCSWSGEGSSWTNGNRTIKATCSDSGSGCTSGTASKSWTYSSGTTSTAYLSYTITDGVGHSVTCGKTAGVYVDKDPPSFSSTGGANVTFSEGSCSYPVGSWSDSGSGFRYGYVTTTSNGSTFFGPVITDAGPVPAINCSAGASSSVSWMAEDWAGNQVTYTTNYTVSGHSYSWHWGNNHSTPSFCETHCLTNCVNNFGEWHAVCTNTGSDKPWGDGSANPKGIWCWCSP